MEISITLIIPTLGRKNDIIRLLKSLNECTINEKIDLEVIIIDQNSSAFGLNSILNEFKNKMNVNYIHSEMKGLSYNRNKALKESKLKDYILFTDDDNVFEKSFFLYLRKYINTLKSFDLLIGNALNLEDKEPYTYRINQEKIARLSLKDFKKIISWNIILPKEKLRSVGFFDESFGVGSFYGACEESDFVIRILNRRESVVYSLPDCKIFHPKRFKNYQNFIRNKNYSIGFGAFYKKQIKLYQFKTQFYFFIDFLRLLIISFGGLILYVFNNQRRKHYINSIVYKIKGFIQYP